MTQSRSTATEMPICRMRRSMGQLAPSPSGCEGRSRTHRSKVLCHREERNDDEEPDQGRLLSPFLRRGVQAEEAREEDGVAACQGALLRDDGPSNEPHALEQVDEVSDRAGEDDGCARGAEAEDGRLEGCRREELDKEQVRGELVGALLPSAA